LGLFLGGGGKAAQAEKWGQGEKRRHIKIPSGRNRAPVRRKNSKT